ncbi:SNF2-related protein, partial [Streptococcus uberis]|uniref:SNF2-related protein n=1 Tax=Streptococcus uberis TaxID=1349 RepID=UPI002EA49D2F|nr:SNF2-related protein [Streptococcus uberis]
MVFSEKLKESMQPQYQGKNIVNDFYNPCLSESDLYQRVSAYFSSKGLELYSKGLDKLIVNNGYAHFIISTDISEQDFNLIKQGYSIKESLSNLSQSIRETILNSETKENLGNLAFLIASNRAEVKFALIKSGKGIFHDKFGLISSEGETIFFTGSANETKNGLDINYESISVDFSWEPSLNVRKRIEFSKKRFERLWNGVEDEVITLNATEVVYSEIKKYQTYSKYSIDSKKNCVIFDFKEGHVIREDFSDTKITEKDRMLKVGSDLSSKYFEPNNKTLKSEYSYRDILHVIELTKKRCSRKNIKVCISEKLENYIQDSKYSIEEYKKLGIYLKNSLDIDYCNNDIRFQEFVTVVNDETERELKPLQMLASYFELRMARAGNFSVPGSGKTTMLLAVFAYLNSEITDEHINRMVVICPINAFASWKEEFSLVFGKKKKLYVIDCQSQNDFEESLRINWNIANLVLVNYESLPKYKELLLNFISFDTMVVFDEVHRIKNPVGKRAESALELVKNVKFKYVLTGTPIPNSYLDIYNFLHLLYGSEYSSFFGWSIDDLKSPSVFKMEEINDSLFPFFWRVSKEDLGVPRPDEDLFIEVEASLEQIELAEAIYCIEESSLARLIRLIQVSTNPELLKSSINYAELGFQNDDGLNGFDENDFNRELSNITPSLILGSKSYNEFDLTNMISPKFEKGINKIIELTSEGKKVIVWGVFVDTLKKIHQRLANIGIKSDLVYGETNVSEREKIINDFKFGTTEVLISNPQTLGEAVSLHHTVHDAVYFEYNFNLTSMLQSRDRIHRLGLKDSQYTRYHYLQTRKESIDSSNAGFIDQQIYDRLKLKEEIMLKAIDNNHLEISFGEDELREAIRIIDEERQ